jgi:hypothetical protein
MIRLIALAVIMLLSSTAFSQTATKKNTTDSIVALPKGVAIEVVKDLIRKDSLDLELNTVKGNYKLLEKNLTVKDSIIGIKDNIISIYVEKEKNFNTIIEFKDLQKKNLEDQNKQLTKEIKRQKIKLFFRTSFGLAIIGGLTYLLIK